jgi:putative membrane protein
MKGFLNYLKGLAMGVCSLIPGVSGGTMALILGVYERLIVGIGSFSVKQSLYYFKFNKSPKERRASKSYAKRLDLSFVLTIIFGSLTMLFVGATGILKLLEVHYAYTIAFFIGLIVASGFFIYHQIKKTKLSTIIIFTFLGIILGVSFFFIVPHNLVSPPFWYLILSGFFSVSALFFPGISGSLILLLLGVYEFMLSIVSNPFNNLIPILGFGIGMIIGAVLVSKLIAYLLKKYHSATLYFLIGLIIGSLGIPVRKVLMAGIPNYLLTGIFFVLGFILVLVLERVNS